MRVDLGQVSIVVGDRAHWQVDAWRLNVTRWCPGAPCHLDEVERRPHRVRVRLWRRAWSRRYDTPADRWDDRA